MDPSVLTKGNFYNDSDEFVKPEIQPTVDFIDLMKSSNYKNNFKLTFDESLNGLTTHHQLFTTNETHNMELYNGWNFTKFHYWDTFLYEDETNKLFDTN